jgi:hypothetical protein
MVGLEVVPFDGVTLSYRHSPGVRMPARWQARLPATSVERRSPQVTGVVCVPPRARATWSIDVGQPVREHVSKAAVAAPGGDRGRAALS